MIRQRTLHGKQIYLQRIDSSILYRIWKLRKKRKAKKERTWDKRRSWQRVENAFYKVEHLKERDKFHLLVHFVDDENNLAKVTGSDSFHRNVRSSIFCFHCPTKRSFDFVHSSRLQMHGCSPSNPAVFLSRLPRLSFNSSCQHQARSVERFHTRGNFHVRPPQSRLRSLYTALSLSFTSYTTFLGPDFLLLVRL